MRKAIKTYGSHGRSVRVFVQTFEDRRRQDLVRVEWRESGRKRMESLPNSRENQAKAKAFAEGVAERLALKGVPAPERMTVYALGEAYLLAHPSPETWRPKTRKTFIARWKVVLSILTPERFIDTVTPETVDQLRARMRSQDYAVNQIANHVQLVKSIYRFARARKYLAENPIADYVMKLSRDQRRLEVPEWSANDCARILAELNPRKARQWRAYVAIVLDATLGARATALLGLETTDVDLNARTVRWRPELDKLAKDRTQPLPRDAVRAFRIAAVWRRWMNYPGPYILPGAQKRRVGPFTYQGLNQALHAAADRAGVMWIDYRAMHGFRRYVLNNVLGSTGNLTRAGQYIGDTDMRTLTRSYVRSRPEELRDVASNISLPKSRRPKGDEMATEAAEAKSENPK